MSADGPNGVVAALRLEWTTARPLARAGWLLVCSGAGAQRARAAAETLLAAGCRRLLLWGTAGALVPDLRPGTLLLPDAVVAADGVRYPSDPAWRARLRAGLPDGCALSEAALATRLAPLATRAEKEACARRSGAVAVDLEAGAVAALAAERATPFAVLRAVVDPLELDLPPAAALAALGRWPELATALRLLARPGDLGAVLQLARALRPARRALERAARALAAAA